MPFDIGALGQQAAGEVANGALGLVLGNINDKRQLSQQEKLQALQIRGQKEMTDYNRQSQLAMWNATGPEAQMNQLKGAGLNPALIYGNSGGGGQTASVTGGNVQGASAPQGGGEAIKGMEMGLQLQMQQAQIEMMKSQAVKNLADAKKTGGVDTDLTSQTIDNTRQAFQNTELDMTMKRILNFEQQASQGDRLDYIEYQTKSAINQAGIIANQKNISDETLAEQITTIKQQAIESALKNILIQAQIPNVKADTIVKQEQVKKIANEILQGWGQLDVAQKNQKVQELAQTMSANNPSIMGVIGRELNTAIENIYNLTGKERKSMKPGNGLKQ